MDNLSVAFQDFHGVCRTYVWGRAKVTTKDHCLVRECRDAVAKHDPVIPAELTNLADVGGVAGHDGLRYPPLCREDITSSVGPDESGKLKAVVPEQFRAPCFDHESRGASFELADSPLSRLLPRRVGFSLSELTVRLL